MTEQPTRLEILTARAQVALDRRRKVTSPQWLLALAATDLTLTEHGGSGIDRTVPVAPRPSLAVPPAGERPRRALALLPADPMSGHDVLDLQHRLVTLGYGEQDLADGVFGPATETSVRRLQLDYDILNDGICGRVTQRVLRYLEEHGIDRDHPATSEQRNMIRFVVRAQQGGFVIIDMVSGARQSPAAASIVVQVGRRLEEQLTVYTGMQSWILDGTFDDEQIVSFARNIQAELFITLGVADQADTGPGCATYYFGTEPDVYSHPGRPLAAAVEAEIVRVARAQSRGVHREYSLLFEQVPAPTIRVELGNLAAGWDRYRLGDNDYLDRLAIGVATGVRNFYLLGQADDEAIALNLGTGPRNS